MTGLYVHIPFCAVKCFYCDFAAFSGQQKQVERYLAALEAEAAGDAAATAYAAHPYQFPIIGWASDIGQTTLADVQGIESVLQTAAAAGISVGWITALKSTGNITSTFSVSTGSK